MHASARVCIDEEPYQDTRSTEVAVWMFNGIVSFEVFEIVFKKY